MTLGSAIKLVRTARHTRQKALAQKLNVSPNYLSMVEANKRMPSIDFLEQIAVELEVPAGLFLLWTEAAKPKLKRTQAKQLRDLLIRIQAIYLQSEIETDEGEPAA